MLCYAVLWSESRVYSIKVVLHLDPASSAAIITVVPYTFWMSYLSIFFRVHVRKI